MAKPIVPVFRAISAVAGPAAFAFLLVSSSPLPSAGRAEIAEARVRPALEADLAAKNLRWGAPVFVRIFKQPRELELWLRGDERFELFRTYPICAYSGDLGPKLREGDGQSPEGFYDVVPSGMNPYSRFHLSFNLGFPNAYDRAHGRTGSYLMVHGDCVSIGCYAMTDAGIEQIYSLAAAALEGGQRSFPVHVFPFRMTARNLERHKDSKWIDFWRNLAGGYERFERDGLPPAVAVSDGRYSFPR